MKAKDKSESRTRKASMRFLCLPTVKPLDGDTYLCGCTGTVCKDTYCPSQCTGNRCDSLECDTFNCGTHSCGTFDCLSYTY